jgi:hypothetical protein
MALQMLGVSILPRAAIVSLLIFRYTEKPPKFDGF